MNQTIKKFNLNIIFLINKLGRNIWKHTDII
jgi:hypothetical protein